MEAPQGQSPSRSIMRRPAAVRAFRLAEHVTAVNDTVLDALLAADEKNDVAPALAEIIGSVDETPHGPTEIADLLDVHLTVLDRSVFTAVAIKGKSWPEVRARDVTYQMARAAQVEGVGLLVLAAVGNIQDDVKRDIAWLAGRKPCDWMILDRVDLAKIFIAYGKLCPRDGTWLGTPTCPACGYIYTPPLPPETDRIAAPRYTVLSLEDVSHGGAKRYSANILVPPGLQRAQVEKLIAQAVGDLRRSTYTRSQTVEVAHGARLADVVFQFVYEDVTQRPFANWIARSVWISKDLREPFRPMTFGRPAGEPELWIDWNTNYETLAAFMASHTADKGRYLKELDRFLDALPGVTDPTRRLLAADALQDRHEATLHELGRKAVALPRPDPMLAAPFELADLDLAYADVDTFLTNVFLPFGERGPVTWPEPDRRRWIARDALQRLDKALDRLRFEREKAK